jgi:hypothetical protein
VACVIILLFALRLNTVTPDNMEPKYTSGDTTYERRPAASSSAEAPSAEAPVVEVPAEMPAADNATGDVYYNTESGESSSFSDGSGFAPMPSVPSDDEERAGGEVYIETAEVTDGDAPDGAVYAVIHIYGELPDMLLDKPEQALDGDSYSIEVTRDEAAKLTGELGFYAELTGVEADVALVIYTP